MEKQKWSVQNQELFFEMLNSGRAFPLNFGG